MLMFKKFKEKVKKNRKGYTLTELIVVVAILGILAAVGAPMIMNQVNTARANADASNAKAIENAYKMYIASTENATIANDAPGACNYVRTYLNPIPTTRNSNNEFMINLSTGAVTVAATGATATGDLANYVDLQ
jgi:type IV pilus assembly protein PilA